MAILCQGRQTLPAGSSILGFREQFRASSLSYPLDSRNPSEKTNAYVHYATTSEEKITEVERELGYVVGISEGVSAAE